jgi:hypothetical protein
MAKKESTHLIAEGWLEPQDLKLPTKPSFAKRPELKKEEHKRWPKLPGQYRPIKDLGEPTCVKEADNGSLNSKR